MQGQRELGMQRVETLLKNVRGVVAVMFGFRLSQQSEAVHRTSACSSPEQQLLNRPDEIAPYTGVKLQAFLYGHTRQSARYEAYRLNRSCRCKHVQEFDILQGSCEVAKRATLKQFCYKNPESLSW